MNKSAIFKKAHQLTKGIIKTGDSYSATFSACLKVVYAEVSSPNTAQALLDMGLKVWENHGKKRIYMTVEQFNKVTGSSYALNNRKNKIFYDYSENAIMRSYNGKKPTIEVKF